MDPVTHAVVGLLIGSKSDGGISLANGVLVASTIGAIAPDLDIVTRCWGDYAYLKHHRGFSHSIIGLGFLSFLISGLLSLVYPSESFSVLFLWTLFGALSHIGLDLLNSYGIEIFGPFNKKKWTLNLFMLFDPIFVLLLIILIVTNQGLGIISLSLIGYLILRWLIRQFAEFLVKQHLAAQFPEVTITVLPSLNLFFRWDFIAHVPGKSIVGYVDLIQRKSKIVHHLHQINQEIEKLLLESILGKFFLEFTPFYHVEYEDHDDKIVGHFIDLRYRFKDRFLHNGILIMDKNMVVKEAIFQPFSLSRRINLNQLKV